MTVESLFLLSLARLIKLGDKMKSARIKALGRNGLAAEEALVTKRFRGFRGNHVGGAT
jgi:hypothetical protein